MVSAIARHTARNNSRDSGSFLYAFHFCFAEIFIFR